MYNCSHGNAVLPRQAHYDVTVVQRSVARGGGSLISKANESSVFEYNFNTAAFPPTRGVLGGLIVRVQDEERHPEWVGRVPARARSGHQSDATPVHVHVRPTHSGTRPGATRPMPRR